MRCILFFCFLACTFGVPAGVTALYHYLAAVSPDWLVIHASPSGAPEFGAALTILFYLAGVFSFVFFGVLTVGSLLAPETPVCDACSSVSMAHCAHPEECGGPWSDEGD